MSLNVHYFLEQCSLEVGKRWCRAGNNWTGAMHAFFSPRDVRAWGNLSDVEQAQVEDSLKQRFGQVIRVGTVRDNFFYYVEPRMESIFHEFGEPFDAANPFTFRRTYRKIQDIATQICGRMHTPISDVVYPSPGSAHPVYTTSAYINAYPYCPPLPSGPPPDTPELPELEPPKLESPEPAKEPTYLTLRLRIPSKPKDDTDIEESDSGTDIEDDPVPERDPLADTDDEAIPPPRAPPCAPVPCAPAPLPVAPVDVTVSMKMAMFYRYMRHIGNTKLVRIQPLPAIQLLLTPAEYADLRASFPAFENKSADGWWDSHA